MINKLEQLFNKVAGVSPSSVVKLTGDGSNRTYYRMTADGVSLIGAVGTSVQENRAFIAIAQCFNRSSIDAPTVLAVSDDELCYLQSDLGETSLFMKMRDSRESGVFSDEDTEALCRVMSILPDIQYRVADILDFDVCYPVADFDRRTIMWDLNYFKYCFLKGVGVEFDESMLENEFERLTAILLEEDCATFLYRDFQSRNIMWHDGRPWFIDFQGGRRGPIYYDVASFVGQARARYTPKVVEAMLDAYILSLSKYRKVERDDFMKKLQCFRLFRLLQNLGTYGLRGIFERKKKFVESIPNALMQLHEILCSTKELFPVLCKIIEKVRLMPRFTPVDKGHLVVDVFSFSYHRGIPEDYSGNGGGFVFDCRAVHNPGRYQEYKKLTGMDAPVIKFLEEKSNITEFLNSVYSLVDPMVENYLERGFSHIQLCFGCTGGQHRSVYSAEHTAWHIAEKFGVKVNVNHIMQNKVYSIENGKSDAV
ncbi:MAG: phosphotransferase [Bacteroidaceae bacterium]|nr:phosphotransferase [Bacteroidaceae bacterium]